MSEGDAASALPKSKVKILARKASGLRLLHDQLNAVDEIPVTSSQAGHYFARRGG